MQRLCLVIAVNCASQGIVPVRFNVAKDAIVTVAHGTFALCNLWQLHDIAMVEVESVEPMPKTTYPALRISALVSRKPAYFLANVIVPMSTLAFLGLLQFLLPCERENINVTFRITYTVTILLTSATYKLFIASALPIGLAYLTLLDKYVLFCYLLQVAIVTESAIVGSYVLRTPPHVLAQMQLAGTSGTVEGASTWLPVWSTSEGDFACACGFMSMFILGHVWFFYRLWSYSDYVNVELQEFQDAEHNRTMLANGGKSFTNYRRKATQSLVEAAKRRESSLLSRSFLAVAPEVEVNRKGTILGIHGGSQQMDIPPGCLGTLDSSPSGHALKSSTFFGRFSTRFSTTSPKMQIPPTQLAEGSQLAGSLAEGNPSVTV